MVLSKATRLRFTTTDFSYGTFKDYPATIYDKWLFLWYFQRLPSYDLRLLIVPTVLSKTALLRFTTNDCSYGTFKDCPPTIYDKWLFLWYFQRLPSYDLQQRLFLWYFQRLPSYDLRRMIVPIVLSKTALLRCTTTDCSCGTFKDWRLLIVYLLFSLFSWLSWLIWNQKICTDGHKQQQLNALVFVLLFFLVFCFLLL